MFSTRIQITAIVVMGSISVLAASAQAATITWNGDGDGTSWHDADNWDLNQVPMAGDDVIIPDVGSTAVVLFNAGTTAINSLDCGKPFQLSGGTLDIADTTAFSDTYTQTFGTLTGTSDVTVQGATAWTGGVMGGSGTTMLLGDVTLGGGGQKGIQDTRVVENHATATWTGGRFILSDATATFRNMPTGIFDIQTDDDFFSAAFDNQGMLLKSAGTGETVFIAGAVFDNSGSVEVQVGTLRPDNGGTSTGSWDIDDGAVLRFLFSTYNMDPGTTIGGLGAVAIAGGTVNFNAPVTPGALIMSGGVLQGSAVVTVLGATEWTFGVMAGSGTTVLLGNVTLSGSQKRIQDTRVVENHATATWTGGQFITSDTTATFRNMPTGTFDIQTDVNFSQAAFDNQGTLLKSAGGGETAFGGGAVFTNSGSVTVQVGTLRFNSGGTSTGPWQMDNGAVARFGGGTYNLDPGSTMAGPGAVTVSGGTVNFTAQSWQAHHIQTGGTINFDAPATPGALLLSGGVLQGSAVVTVQGTTEWTAGVMGGSGTTALLGDATLGGGQKGIQDTRVVENHATATWTSGRFILSDATATFRNMPTGIFDIQADDDFFSAAFDNQGTLLKSAGGGETAFGGGAVFTNSGSVTVQVGTLRFNSGYTQTAGATELNGGQIDANSSSPLVFQGGELRGEGLIGGPVNNVGGNITPGFSAGQIDIDDTYTQSGEGTLTIEVGGTKPGEYDVLAVDTANLGGVLDVQLIDGFTPAGGEEITFLTATSNIEGKFTSADCSFYYLDYEPNAVKLVLFTEACPTDLTCDGKTGPLDLALVLGFWGPCDEPCEPGEPATTCRTDLNGDCTTGPFDLALILGFWGPCP